MKRQKILVMAGDLTSVTTGKGLKRCLSKIAIMEKLPMIPNANKIGAPIS